MRLEPSAWCSRYHEACCMLATSTSTRHVGWPPQPACCACVAQAAMVAAAADEAHNENCLWCSCCSCVPNTHLVGWCPPQPHPPPSNPQGSSRCPTQAAGATWCGAWAAPQPAPCTAQATLMRLVCGRYVWGMRGRGRGGCCCKGRLS